MLHAMGVGLLVLASGCAMPTPAPATALPGVRQSWFYVPGPYQTTQRIEGQRTENGTRTARVLPEAGGAWTVTIGAPATTIVVARLSDGRPATARIANPERNETAVFDPPLALVPGALPTETSSVTLYQGVHPSTDLSGMTAKRSGEAERRFLALEETSWQFGGTEYPAQRLTHELVLKLSPAEVRQRYESTAVEGLGIVQETMIERLGVMGVRIGGREEASEVIEFDPPPQELRSR